MDLMEGSKRDSEITIGRRGKGFCSLFVFGDTVWICSVDRVWVSDPGMEYIRGSFKDRPVEEGATFRFRNNKNKLTSWFKEDSDNFKALSEGFDVDFTKQLDATYVRIPLRTKASEMCSDVPFTKDSSVPSFRDLAKTSLIEAKYYLLFLRHTRSWFLTEVEKDGTKCALVEVVRDDMGPVGDSGRIRRVRITVKVDGKVGVPGAVYNFLMCRSTGNWEEKDKFSQQDVPLGEV